MSTILIGCSNEILYKFTNLKMFSLKSLINYQLLLKFNILKFTNLEHHSKFKKLLNLYFLYQFNKLFDTFFYNLILNRFLIDSFQYMVVYLQIDHLIDLNKYDHKFQYLFPYLTFDYYLNHNFLIQMN